MRHLFENPTILGYSGMTGWAINNAMLGDGFIRPHFFNNLTVGDYSSENIVNAWINSAKWGYGGGSMESMFRAVDEDGQEWKLANKAVVKGRKF